MRDRSYDMAEKMFWRGNVWHYNTVALSRVSFIVMQAIRFLAVICLTINFVAFLFIFFRTCPEYLNFWALLFTLIAMVSLFIGSGLEMVQ